jgi:hypothetical protein
MLGRHIKRVAITEQQDRNTAGRLLPKLTQLVRIADRGSTDLDVHVTRANSSVVRFTTRVDVTFESSVVAREIAASELELQSPAPFEPGVRNTKDPSSR